MLLWIQQLHRPHELTDVIPELGNPPRRAGATHAALQRFYPLSAAWLPCIDKIMHSILFQDPFFWDFSRTIPIPCRWYNAASGRTRLLCSLLQGLVRICKTRGPLPRRPATYFCYGALQISPVQLLCCQFVCSCEGAMMQVMAIELSCPGIAGL